MMKNEMTYAVALETAINAVADEAVKEKLTALKATIEKRKSAPSKKKVEAMNANLTAVYEALLAFDEPVSVTDLMKGATNEVAGFTAQKVTAMLTKLCADGRAVKTVEKRKSYYAIAE